MWSLIFLYLRQFSWIFIVSYLVVCSLIAKQYVCYYVFLSGDCNYIKIEFLELYLYILLYIYCIAQQLAIAFNDLSETFHVCVPKTAWEISCLCSNDSSETFHICVPVTPIRFLHVCVSVIPVRHPMSVFQWLQWDILCMCSNNSTGTSDVCVPMFPVRHLVSVFQWLQLDIPCLFSNNSNETSHVCVSMSPMWHPMFVFQ